MIDVDLVQLAMETESLQLADVVWLIAFGEPAEQICTRVHAKPNSVGMLLTRHGLPELARPFWRLERYQRPHRRRQEPPLVIPVTPHGTWDRWRLHAALGEPPCASCAIAGAEHWNSRRAA